MKTPKETADDVKFFLDVVAVKAVAAEKARLDLELSIQIAVRNGASLRQVAANTSMSHETVRQIVQDRQ